MTPPLRAILRWMMPAAIVFGTAACKKPEYPACKKDKHCKVEEGEKCVDGVCQNCTTDTDCVGKGPGGANWVCHEFRCTDPSQVGPGGTAGVGAPCTQAMDCQSGLVCKAGACSNCSEDAECGPGGTCDLSTGLCSTGQSGGAGQCTSDNDCAMDEICDNGSCVFSGLQPGESKCGIDAVYFGFDSPKIEAETAQKLQAAADCIKSTGEMVYLEAHADPRGTEEYNIMLTERRGANVKDFLADLGVPGDKMQVIAKGDLEATGSDESGWAKDRRVQFIWP